MGVSNAISSEDSGLQPSTIIHGPTQEKPATSPGELNLQVQLNLLQAAVTKFDGSRSNQSKLQCILNRLTMIKETLAKDIEEDPSTNIQEGEC